MSNSIEDLLILKYQKYHTGEIYKEVPVGQVENKMRKRRIDAILIENKNNEIYERGDYSLVKIKDKIKDNKIHLIEAKKNLGRNVVGQVEVGKYLVESEFKPNKIISVALCAKSHPDIKKYCNKKDIKVKIYNINTKNSDTSIAEQREVKADKNIDYKIDDIRDKPDKKRYGAFKRGWEDATKGKLYNSVNNKKTHTNIGNLFGWIYGECSDEMKKRVWEQYIKNNKMFLDMNW